MPTQFIDFKGKPVKDVGKRFDISSEINAAEIIGIYFLIRHRIASLIPFAKGALFPLLPAWPSSRSCQLRQSLL